MEASIILYSAALPALFSFVLIVIARRPWRADIDAKRAAPWRWGSWGPAASVALAVLTTFHGVRGIRPKPIDAAEWLPYIALVALAVGLLFARRESRPAWRAAERLLAALAVVSIVMWWKFDRAWTPIVGGGWLALAALVTAAHWRAVESCFTSARVGTGLFVVGAATAAAAVCLGMTGSALLAQLAGSAALALGVGFILLAWRRAGAPGAPAAAVLSLLTAGLLLLGMTQARLPWASAALLAFAPMVTALAIALTERSRGVALRVALPLALGVLCILGAIGTSAAAFEPSSGGDEVEYDYSGM